MLKGEVSIVLLLVTAVRSI